MKRKKVTLEQGLYLAGLIAFCLGMPFLFWYIPQVDAGVLPPCMLNRYFGIYCPGCGGSRAVMALIQGKFLDSLYYHPLVLYGAVLYLAFMLSQTVALLSRGRLKGLRFHQWFLFGAVFLIVLNCLIKNILKFCFGIDVL